jgi:hypothetical protein
LILKENIALLKRELSLLSSNYREITVSYYIKGEKIPEIADHVHTTNHIPGEYTKRPQQGNWDITGYEACSLPISLRMSHDGSGEEKNILMTYKISMENLWERAGMLSSHEVSVAAASIRSGKTMDALSDIEKDVHTEPNDSRIYPGKRPNDYADIPRALPRADGSMEAFAKK